ncbi:MAG: ATP-dependent DNA helicase RecQ [Bacteroidales bacterium]|nr:ATP-dependent DNA helicase RecQ [Bacteroidales bacterium]
MQETMRYSSLKEYVTQKVKDIIDFYLVQGKGWFFVIVGLNDIIDSEKLKENIDDFNSFEKNGNETVFDKNWFKRILPQLADDEKDCHILSYSQYVYASTKLQESFFGEKVVFIRDNLRHLYLLDKDSFLGNLVSDEEVRPDELPLYQAEQIKLDDEYYCMLLAPSGDSKTVDVFSEELDLNYIEQTKYSNRTIDDTQILDVTSDKYALDIFINQCFREGDLSNEITIKYFQKQPDNRSFLSVLRKLNFLLNQFGGVVTLKNEDSVETTVIRPEIKRLFHKYWGEKADFRSLKVYRNPNVNKETVEISQGMLVETIIDEYEKSKKGIIPRDLFLTAPTGAGKSLLFQLPAFHISDCGDVTIIVSPLIALMKDQVKAIINERNFDKVTYINSELNVLDRNRIIENIKTGIIDIIYLSPELLLSYDLSFFIGERRLGLLVIDEAHLITTWGRDFRVDYWFLGNYIRKSRKYHEGNFPMVAVTATAVYGGINDMVFDSIDSLYMQNPRIYIGQVKRDDIDFVINNFEKIKKGYDKYKIQQTVNFIKAIVNQGLKTIVYVPYTKHINLISGSLPSDLKDSVASYHGTLDSDLKEYSYMMFKSGKKKVMLCTKAFGMGVDIPDIQVVYHHTPSGLLPDYIQEIGRVARKEGLQGYAMLDYSPQDQKYSKILHGMSAIRQWQLKEVLKKIYALYVKHGNRRNMLVSVDDFALIFEGAIDLDQKVLTSLMMLEKDYLARHRFNVLIARPRKLYSTVYAKLSNDDLKVMKRKYPKIYELRQDLGNGKAVVELDLALLWEKNFSDKSFPVIKRDFYNGHLFDADSIIIKPQIKVSFNLSIAFNEAYNTLSDFFELLQEVFSKLTGKYFSQESFQKELVNGLKDKKKAEKIAKFVLSSYSGYSFENRSESQSFLQIRSTWGRNDYCVYSAHYMENFAYLLKRFAYLFENTDSNMVNKYVTNNDLTMVSYTRLGYFLELLDIGTYEMKGGENPVVFIRLNDPERIKRDAFNAGYKNLLLQKTLQKFEVSNQIFDYFFCRKFSNEERWSFIEDFFLGADNDVLEKRYTGANVSNDVDLLEFIESILPEQTLNNDNEDNENLNFFLPNPNVWYTQSTLLTIETDKGKVTHKISEWLKKNPVLLDQVRTKHNLKFSSEVFRIMVSKVRQNTSYFTESRGLNVRIEFKGYPGIVQASLPYKDKPVEFYKWWCKNEDKVYMTIAEKIQLFIRVKALKPDALLKVHEKLIS